MQADARSARRRTFLALLGPLLLGGIGAASAQTAPAAQAAMPPLPQVIRDAGVVRVGVRCDQPPYGFQDQAGAFAGVEVEMVKQMAAWALGDPGKAEMTCVTADTRIPQLNGRKVDLLVATLGMTAERARVVDFSRGYNWGASAILVPKDSPVAKLDDVAGRTVVMLKGTTQAAWFDANMPSLSTLRLNSVSDALQALKQRRADAMAGDRATLLVIATRDPSLRRLDEAYAGTEGAAAVRKGEAEWLAWVNAALDRMKAEGRYRPWIERWVPEENRASYVEAFSTPPPKAR